MACDGWLHYILRFWIPEIVWSQPAVYNLFTINHPRMARVPMWSAGVYLFNNAVTRMWHQIARAQTGCPPALKCVPTHLIFKLTIDCRWHGIVHLIRPSFRIKSLSSSPIRSSLRPDQQLSWTILGPKPWFIFFLTVEGCVHPMNLVPKSAVASWSS